MQHKPSIVTVPVSEDGMIGIRDDVAAMHGIQDFVKHARARRRDEANKITWVYDRLYGLVPLTKEEAEAKIAV